MNRRHLPSPALVVASIALLVALGGTGYAAFKLPANSVGSVEVRDRSLLGRDFARGQLPAGPQGPSGATAIRWASFRANGALVRQNASFEVVARPEGNSYIVDTGASARGKALVVTSPVSPFLADHGAQASTCGGPPEGIACPTANDENHVWVYPDPSGPARAFTLLVLG